MGDGIDQGRMTLRIIGWETHVVHGLTVQVPIVAIVSDASSPADDTP